MNRNEKGLVYQKIYSFQGDHYEVQISLCSGFTFNLREQWDELRRFPVNYLVTDKS